MFPCGFCFLSHPSHQSIRPGRLLSEERAVGGLFRSEQSFSMILGGCFTPSFIRMDTMHKGTTWPETVPFWACLTAIWQDMPHDASGDEKHRIHLRLRSPSSPAQRIAMLAHSLAPLHPCTPTFDSQSYAVGCCFLPSISGIGVTPI
jgi:hypothetical protein